jgi:hypothetical protein
MKEKSTQLKRTYVGRRPAKKSQTYGKDGIYFEQYRKVLVGTYNGSGPVPQRTTGLCGHLGHLKKFFGAKCVVPWM